MSSEKELMEDIVKRLSVQPSQYELIQQAIQLGEQELIQIESLFADTMQQVKGFAFGNQIMCQQIDEAIASTLKRTKHLLNHSFTTEQISRMTFVEKNEAKEMQETRMHYMNDLLVRQHKKH